MALNCTHLKATMAALVILALPMSSHAIELVFGQVASQTNPTSAANAKGMAAGIQAYFDKVNAGSTLQGNKLKLVTLDDGLQAPKMLELTQQLIGDPAVVGLLGFLNSAGLAEIAKQDLPGKNGIALIAPLQGDKNVVSASNVFPLRSGYADEVGSLLKEAKTWGKDSLAIVNMSVAFGPPLAQLTTQLSGPQGVKIVTQQVLDAAPDKLDASVRAAAAAITETRPKGIILLAAGKPAFEFVKAVRDVPGGAVQIYGLSVLLHDGLVNAVGKDKARGIVLSQAVPFPFVPSKPVITEYQADMKKYAPGEALSFSSLEGYMGAKIAVEAVRRAGKTPTRAGVLQALSNLGEYNLGGVFVNYTANQRTGWGGVDLSIVNSSGNLQK
ncbi:ABC transporter substrate-binding protein [Polaromonas sp. JS666]|uniref:ABC transporter substrate-binding protein n=1 Tax=Polaromonas sp. (strain JS666 / ATCC BAA-500) TaxID=296591 RepID=UPI0008845C1D|nr:ABC transporter substrate-binding protein [Polaromonas sp. JS666]SDN94574.1 ABC-type branched-chain amino acid transport system, substrate-binding protein [Polaromonas sp. JS666]